MPAGISLNSPSGSSTIIRGKCDGNPAGKAAQWLLRTAGKTAGGVPLQSVENNGKNNVKCGHRKNLGQTLDGVSGGGGAGRA